MKKNTEQQAETKTAYEQETPAETPNKNKELYGLESEDKIEVERRKAYIEPKTRELLRELIRCEDRNEIIPKAYIEPKTRELLRELISCEDRNEIIPSYVSGLGFVYQLKEKNLNTSEMNTISRDFLENLAILDILQKEFYDSVSVCPNCQSTFITLHNLCPRCKSHNIDKTSLTEHVPCGFIDQKNKFCGNICPKCGEPLVEGKYRNMGRWYLCKECGERFENPEYDIACHNCNKRFSIKEAQLVEIPKFRLNLNRKKEIRQNVASLENIRELLAELGFSVEIPAFATGQKSGVQHQFSLIAKRQVNNQEISVALDHAVSEPNVSNSPLILFIYKISEVKVDIPIFVAMPELNETGKKIAQGHEIILVEGTIDEEKLIEKIKKEIKDRIEFKLMQKEVAKKKAQIRSDPKSLLGRLARLKEKVTT